MEYLKVQWWHNFEEEPILLFHEIDENRIEKRKIEIYKDGSFGIAGFEFEFGGTELSYEAMPSIQEIAKENELIPEVITVEEFEKKWSEMINYLHST